MRGLADTGGDQLGQGRRGQGQVATFGWGWQEGSGPVTAQNQQIHSPPMRWRWPVGGCPRSRLGRASSAAGGGLLIGWEEGGPVAEGLLSASSSVPGDKLSFCIATPEGDSPGKGSRDSGDTGDSW